MRGAEMTELRATTCVSRRGWVILAGLLAASLGAAGCGGCQRRGPTGGAAYGMPSHSLTPLSTIPQTGPLDVVTVVLAAHTG